MSLHVMRAKEKAQRLGAFAGAPCTDPLWNMSKRELVELVVRLGAQVAGEADSVTAGANAALEEHETLSNAGFF